MLSTRLLPSCASYTVLYSSSCISSPRAFCTDTHGRPCPLERFVVIVLQPNGAITVRIGKANDGGRHITIGIIPLDACSSVMPRMGFFCCFHPRCIP